MPPVNRPAATRHANGTPSPRHQPGNAHQHQAGGNHEIAAQHEHPGPLERRQPGGGQLLQRRHGPPGAVQHADPAPRDAAVRATFDAPQRQRPHGRDQRPAREYGHDLHHADAGEQHRGRQDHRQHHQHRHHRAREEVGQAGVGPRTEHGLVVAQQQQEHRGTRQQHTRQRLHRAGQQPQRHARRQHQPGRQQREAEVDGVEALGLGRLAMQRVAHRQHVADGIRGRQRHRARADDAGIQQRDREQDAGPAARLPLQPDGGAQRIGVPAELGRAMEGLRAEGHHGHRARHRQHDAEPQVGALIADEARRDALVDHVALLEKQLPRRHRRPDDRDDQQHHLRQRRTGGQRRHEEVARHLLERRMRHRQHRDQRKAAHHQRQREPLEAAEVARGGGQQHQRSRHAHAPLARNPEIRQREADADELCHQRQRVHQEQVDHGEAAPEPAEAREDQPRMADPRDGAQPQHHLLVHIQHRDQQQQRPQQRGAVVLPGLGVRAEGAGVVVAHHHDEAWAQDGEQRAQTGTPSSARADVMPGDGAERAANIADVRIVQHSTTWWCIDARNDLGHIDLLKKGAEKTAYHQYVRDIRTAAFA
uniref:Uncharacterized protein n=1 Tax=Ralstonia solanacearum TaxID=305 RepID=A0A0S4TV89_RALSL|nr:conserved protein of unknown function [Ralstonia solanacearum]